MDHGTPQAEFGIEGSLVRSLLRTQHPDLADLALRDSASGWDNVTFRLGTGYAVRLPRREIAAQLVVNEQTWLPMLAPRLPIAVPVPVRVGRPASDYPWHWSVVPWFLGEAADIIPIASSEATRFADFLLALHEPAPEGAPHNPFRGCPLRHRDQTMRESLARLPTKDPFDKSLVEEIWAAALEAPEPTDARWLHGDLHPQNVLVADGRITAIIDWGDITSGDVATDLAGVWTLFDEQTAREGILERYAPDSPTSIRAMGWAVLLGVLLLDSGLVNNPRHANAGRQILKRLAEDT